MTRWIISKKNKKQKQSYLFAILVATLVLFTGTLTHQIANNYQSQPQNVNIDDEMASIGRSIQITHNTINNIKDSDSLSTVIKDKKLRQKIVSRIKPGLSLESKELRYKIVSGDRVDVFINVVVQGSHYKKNWSREGQSVYILKKVQNRWIILQTDIYKFLTA